MGDPFLMEKGRISKICCVKDPKDDMLLELAVAGNCGYIITYNIKGFAAVNKFRPKAITPNKLLKLIGE